MRLRCSRMQIRDVFRRFRQGNHHCAVICKLGLAGSMIVPASRGEPFDERRVAERMIETKWILPRLGKPRPLLLVLSVLPSPQVHKAMLSRKIVEVLGAGVSVPLRRSVSRLIASVQVSNDQERARV